MIQNQFNDYLGSLTARYRASPLPGFLAWWRAELAGMFPNALRQRMIPPRPALWLQADEESRGLTVWKSAGGQHEQCDQFNASEDAQLLRDRWIELLNSFDEGVPEVRLLLPPEDVLRCPVELPLAVETNLEQALGFQLDQLTPFQASQVYYDYDIVERDVEHGRINLELRLVPVNRVAWIRERLAAIGIQAHAFDTLDESVAGPSSEGFNLLPPNERPRYVYARARLNWILAGIAAVVLGAVMVQSLYLRGQTVTQLEREVATLRSEADQVMALQRELEDALMAANFLAERRRRQPVVIQVLDEVTRVLPEDMWLQQLQIRGDELVIMGLADGSQRLIQLINDSILLDDAEFRGAVNIDPNTGQERFQARASIQTRRAANAAVAEQGE